MSLRATGSPQPPLGSATLHHFGQKWCYRVRFFWLLLTPPMLNTYFWTYLWGGWASQIYPKVCALHWRYQTHKNEKKWWNKKNTYITWEHNFRHLPCKTPTWLQKYAFFTGGVEKSQLWRLGDALAQLREVGMLQQSSGRVFYICKLSINRPSGRYVTCLVNNRMRLCMCVCS